MSIGEVNHITQSLVRNSKALHQKGVHRKDTTSSIHLFITDHLYDTIKYLMQREKNLSHNGIMMQIGLRVTGGLRPVFFI